jgi:2-oxoglutarate ferredoxin oxidoreductase subunit beta
MRVKQDFHRADPTWCRGCGLYSVFDALKRAAAALDLEPENIVTVTGIGCHGRMNNYFLGYGFHGLHGRTMPLATGIKLANPELRVLAVSGDGDAYSIGLGHFVQAVRKNVGITYIVSDNRVYALTQGQVSPTSDFGAVTLSTPFGSRDFPIDGPKLALAAGGTFIARGFSGEVGELAGLIERAIRHKGFSLVNVLSPCVTHNKVNTYDWFRRRIVHLGEDPAYDASDKLKAWSALHMPDKIATGLIFEEDKPSFEELALPDPRRPIGPSDLTVEVDRLAKTMEKFR